MINSLGCHIWELVELCVAVAIIITTVAVVLHKGLKKRLIPIVSGAVVLICVLSIGGVHFFRAPTFSTTLGSTDIRCDVHNDFFVPDAVVTGYEGNELAVNVEVDGEVNTAVLGDYILKYSYEYRHREYVSSVVVHVVDTQAPAITLIGNPEVKAEKFEDYSESGYTAFDNYDGDISGSVTVSHQGDELSEVVFTYTVTDSSGNTASTERKLKICDITPPVITLHGYSTEYIIIGKDYTEYGAEAYDNKDGDVSGSLSISQAVNTSVEGVYNVTYTANDAMGNVAQATRTVKVLDRETVSGNVIYLTFDDGPSGNTEKILDILKKNNVKATFFVINFNSDDEARTVKRIVDEGHTIAIHGYSHDYDKIYASEAAFMENITSLRSKIKQLTGYEANIIRFPGGSSNTVSNFNPGIMTRLTRRVQDEGYLYYDWNVDSCDASGNKIPASRLVSNVTSGLRRGRANVVLMHDTSAKTTTVDALQRIIDYGNRQGYIFAAITEATPAVHHGLNN